MYQTFEILERINELEEHLQITAEVSEQMDLEQTIQELKMHLAEN